MVTRAVESSHVKTRKSGSKNIVARVAKCGIMPFDPISIIKLIPNKEAKVAEVIKKRRSITDKFLRKNERSSDLTRYRREESN